MVLGTEHEIPDTKRRGGSGKGKAKQGGSRVLAVREAPDTPGIYYATTQLVTVGERSLSIATVKTVDDTGVVKNDNSDQKHHPRDEIAKAAQVSTGQVAQAEKIKRDTPELWERTKAQEISIGAALSPSIRREKD